MVEINRHSVLVTGAAKRIGRAIAIDFGDHGWNVGIHYNTSEADAEETLAEIERNGGRGKLFKADLSRETEVEGLVGRCSEALGPVTCLVNNASVFEYDTVETNSRAYWDMHMEANLRAPMVLSQAMARLLPENQDGSIINILDQRVWNLTPHFLSYTVSKMGLWTLTRTLAMGLAPRIRVNAIGPGPTMRNPRQSEDHFRQQWQSVPLQRPTDPQEICDAIRFLLSAPAMTGQMIALDGGEHLGWAQPARGFTPEE